MSKYLNLKWERRYPLAKGHLWSLMLDIGIATDLYWSELKIKGVASRLRPFPLLDLCWDRMEFEDWGTAQGPAFKCPFLKLRFWFIRNTENNYG